VINVSSGVVNVPQFSIGSNAYVTGKTGLEAHSVNLASELADTGVTVNVFRPGEVDTALFRSRRDKALALKPALKALFDRDLSDGSVLSPDAAAAALLDCLRENVSGKVWDMGTSG
jgi:NAD(P)-dependent dehydrogenase (short-subunit alcohol dehydrogenase family)